MNTWDDRTDRVYVKGSEDPSWTANWYRRLGDGTSVLRDLTGVVLTLDLVDVLDDTVALNKVAGVVGGDGSTEPNVTATWAVAELNIDAGFYYVKLQGLIGGRNMFFSMDRWPLIRIIL
jgi:hypothetical protein